MRHDVAPPSGLVSPSDGAAAGHQRPGIVLWLTDHGHERHLVAIIVLISNLVFRTRTPT